VSFPARAGRGCGAIKESGIRPETFSRRRWFIEGFDTLDVKQAKTLLDELA
jgi:hypothetical protein